MRVWVHVCRSTGSPHPPPSTICPHPSNPTCNLHPHLPFFFSRSWLSAATNHYFLDGLGCFNILSITPPPKKKKKNLLVLLSSHHCLELWAQPRTCVLPVSFRTKMPTCKKRFLSEHQNVKNLKVSLFLRKNIHDGQDRHLDAGFHDWIDLLGLCNSLPFLSWIFYGLDAWWWIL